MEFYATLLMKHGYRPVCSLNEPSCCTMDLSTLAKPCSLPLIIKRLNSTFMSESQTIETLCVQLMIIIFRQLIDYWSLLDV